MDTNKTAQIQEDFIRKKMQFDISKRYFGNISSDDLSQSYRNLQYKTMDQSVDFYISSFNDAGIARNLKEHMSFNPLRWQEIASLDFSYESVINRWDEECWYKDHFGVELYNLLNDVYAKGIFKLNSNVEITMNKNKPAHKNYWILRDMLNIFKKLCGVNVKDFKNPQYRDEIIIAMSRKFPEHVNPKNFGLVLIPNSKPVDLFTKWYWGRQK